MNMNSSECKRERIDPKLRSQILKRDGLHCHYCGTKTSPRTRQLDHVVSVVAGGKNTPNNLVVSCKTCNRRKGKKTYQQYVTQRQGQVMTELRTLMTRCPPDTALELSGFFWQWIQETRPDLLHVADELVLDSLET